MNQTQATIEPMRVLLYVASALVFAVGIPLFVLTEQTTRYFAWTIAPPTNVYLTAAFLGAAYWASRVLEFMAARERIWARPRVAVPASPEALGFTYAAGACAGAVSCGPRPTCTGLRPQFG